MSGVPPLASVHLERAMRRALVLAQNGPTTGGNPQVGCVLLDAQGMIVADGWHHGAGTAHAEVDALSKLPPRSDGTPDATGLTAVVTLEPCNHTGRTGPCTAALIDAGIAHVVYAVSDPGATSGGGAERLREAGVSVESGVLAVEVTEVIHRWLVSARLGRPFVTVKWASSLDGRAAADDGSSQWITGAAARERVGVQRSEADAIAVGTGTVLADNPSLTARDAEGELLEHQPIPVVFGEREVPADALLRQHPAGLIESHSRDLSVTLSELFDRGIRTMYVEGGPSLASAFIAAGVVDEYAIFVAPTLLGGSRTATGDIGVTTIGEQRRLTIDSIEHLGDDLLIMARPEGQ
jgi:diaminohydroxyphosphoribosylaminopyrimidine deaminase/5-amino-6-(5-phosphoribosylamino)uracil reductase